LWERRGGQCQVRLGEALILSKGEWVQALSLPDTLSKVRVGNPCRFGFKRNPIYGRELPIGVYQEEGDRERVVLIKSFRKRLREVVLVGRLDLLGEKRREKKKGKKRGKVFAEHDFFICSNHILGKLFLAFGASLRIQ